MTTLAFALPRTFKMAALVLASATLLACDDDATGIDRGQDSNNATTGDVQGFVTAHGRGVPGIAARLINQDGIGIRLAETNADGEFFFGSLPVGGYEVELQNVDARRAITTRGVFVFGGSTASVVFELSGNADDGENDR